MSDFARELTELVAGLAPQLKGLAPEEQWRQLAGLDLVGIAIPEEQGGSGGELSDLLAVITELARNGLATPIVEGVTAAYAIGHLDVDTFATVVIQRGQRASDGNKDAPTLRVPYAHEASCVVVIAQDAVLSIPLGDVEDQRQSGRSLAGEPFSELRLDLQTAEQLTGVSADEVINRLAVARSAALLGASKGAYEMTRRHALQREQFGAPLIKIPAVAASVAEMATHLGLAQSALARAVAVLGDDGNSSRRDAAASAARIASARTASRVARLSHQLHGAVGVTQEYDLHRFTTALWAWRDADESEVTLSRRLGAAALDAAEPDLWQLLTA